MADRSVLQIDAALREMDATAALPPREESESFRRYFVRAATAWIVVHGEAHPGLTEHVQALIARELRRHPRLADQQPIPQVPVREPG